METREGSARSWIGGVFLALQLVLILGARSVEGSLPRWAPNDFLVDYRITVREPSRELSAPEIMERYGIAQSGGYEYPREALLALVRRREERLGASPARNVEVAYSVNGRPKEKWAWSSTGAR
jgi:hypothetical protein